MQLCNENLHYSTYEKDVTLIWNVFFVIPNVFQLHSVYVHT